MHTSLIGSWTGSSCHLSCRHMKEGISWHRCSKNVMRQAKARLYFSHSSIRIKIDPKRISWLQIATLLNHTWCFKRRKGRLSRRTSFLSRVQGSTWPVNCVEEAGFDRNRLSNRLISMRIQTVKTRTRTRSRSRISRKLSLRPNFQPHHTLRLRGMRKSKISWLTSSNRRPQYETKPKAS